MVDLYQIKADLERMKCPYHVLPPQIRIGDGTLEVESSCCEHFKKLLLLNLAMIVGNSMNGMFDNLRAGHND